MPFIPHTESDVKEMLEAIGAPSIESLFDEIPAALRTGELTTIPEGLNELSVTQLMQARAKKNKPLLCFAGAGAYEHHIPAAVWELTTRGEFYTAYTPYQAEASQGTLQLLYEFQTMMASLTGLDVSNASLYDGASGLAEAILMAVRCNRKSKSRRILLPTTVHPAYRKVSRNIVSNQNIVLEEIPYCAEKGAVLPKSLEKYQGEDIAALVIQQPNFFGSLEDVDALTDWAHAQGAMVIAVVNPMTLAILKPPGEWGSAGVDIACGEGQPLGIPLAGGGPYFGFMCCKQKQVRQLPGRIVGRTVDLEGKEGFTLTLQAREQHIRRSKATSNICTNQGLMTTAATIYMSLLGPEGLRSVAEACFTNTQKLVERLALIDGVEPIFSGTNFHEVMIQLPCAAGAVHAELCEQGILGGYEPSEEYPELGHALLVCVTETRTDEEIEHFAVQLEIIIKKLQN